MLISSISRDGNDWLKKKVPHFEKQFCLFNLILKTPALLSTLGFIEVSRYVKDFITFEISIQQMVGPLSSAPLFSELTRKN